VRREPRDRESVACGDCPEPLAAPARTGSWDGSARRRPRRAGDRRRPGSVGCAHPKRAHRGAPEGNPDPAGRLSRSGGALRSAGAHLCGRGGGAGVRRRHGALASPPRPGAARDEDASGRTGSAADFEVSRMTGQNYDDAIAELGRTAGMDSETVAALEHRLVQAFTEYHSTQPRETVVVRSSSWRRWAAAAAALIVLSGGMAGWWARRAVPREVEVSRSPVAPAPPVETIAKNVVAVPQA